MIPPLTSDSMDLPRTPTQTRHTQRSTPRTSHATASTPRMLQIPEIKPPSDEEKEEAPIYVTEMTDLVEEPSDILLGATSIAASLSYGSTATSTTLPVSPTATTLPASPHTVAPTHSGSSSSRPTARRPGPEPLSMPDSPTPNRSAALNPFRLSRSRSPSPSSEHRHHRHHLSLPGWRTPSPSTSPAALSYEMDEQPSIPRKSASRSRKPGSSSRHQATSSLMPNHKETLMAGLEPTLRALTATSTPYIDQHRDPNAPFRFWETYAVEAFMYDHRTIASWHRNLDVRLIFAGLFSAILTPFIVESYKLLEIEPKASAFGENGYRVRVNAMWFGSLILSLITALLSIHCKQWLDGYGTGVDLRFSEESLMRVRDLEGLSPDETPHDKKLETAPSSNYQDRLQTACRLRQYRYQGLQTYYIQEVIGLLPVLLYLCLLFFAIGLIDWLWQLDPHIAGYILGLCLLVAIFHIITTVVPFFTTRSPYKTPLSNLLGNLWRGMRTRRFVMSGLMEQEESADVEEQRDVLDENSARWLMETTRSETIYEQARLAMREWAVKKAKEGKKKADLEPISPQPLHRTRSA